LNDNEYSSNDNEYSNNDNEYSRYHPRAFIRSSFAYLYDFRCTEMASGYEIVYEMLVSTY